MYVVYHPLFADGAVWASQLDRWLSGDPETYAVPAADVPTFLWTATTTDVVPEPIPFGDADRTVVVLLVDDSWMARPAWRAWATDTATAAASVGLRHTVLVTSASRAALNLRGPFAAQHAIRLDLAPVVERAVELRLRVTHAIARCLLDGGRTAVFLSHTKLGTRPGDQGGRSLALALQGFLQRRPLGTVFFDEVSIEAGEDFGDRLREGVETAVVVVLLTDRFAGRFWCKWEVLTAKTVRRPMLLVDALEHGEPINIAYAGNVTAVPQ
ncbi:MAG TPA: toll/interleukin-1 receptor domain-containing protein, partial [Myxococcota bacterium]|nr:toll/interleukin-1 receptor domain-containing protein [Myxococcota bacterium]